MKKPTIVRYLGTRTVIYFAIMLIGMCVLFSYTISRAQLDAAKQTVSIESRRASRHIVKLDDGTLAVDQEMLDDLEFCDIAVITSAGEIVSGDIPEELEKELSEAPADEGFRSVRADGKVYYICDHRAMHFHREHGEHSRGSGGKADGEHSSGSGGKADDIGGAGTEKSDQNQTGNDPGAPEDDPGEMDRQLKGYYIRAVLCKDDFKTVYHNIQLFFYSFVALLVIVFVIAGVWLYRRAARPVREMCDDVQKLVEDPDYSGRVENTSLFYETEVMTNAYNKLMDRNEKLISQQEEFNENVSHELKTPIAVIRSEVELLQDLYGKELPEEARESLSVMHKQSDRINAMITELRYMAKMDRENFALNKEEIALSDIAESVCDDIEDVTLGGRKFAYHWDQDDAAVDVALVMVAVRNLIINAVKYSPEGSIIDLFSGTIDGMAFLKVSDKGEGIAEEDLDRIFEPYYQVKSERNSDGFGLGLALTMKIAEKHGGTVTVDSEQGKGSTFTLMLPVK
ncbi:MAG: HAMP domain-containing histidine kinase [Eubacterium sp.]|nr:HAMP domain-containing histidine kinase [Eubacterium sp.]